MKTLAYYTPAQVILLLKGKRASLKDLLKGTFMDLLLRQVITTEEEVVGKKRRLFVMAGKSFSSYRYHQHDLVFLQPFFENRKIRLSFGDLVRGGYERAGGAKKFIRSILRSPEMVSSYASGLTKLLKGSLTKTTSGDRLTQVLRNEVDELQVNLPVLLKNDPDLAYRVLEELKGNIVLIPSIDLRMIATLENELLIGERSRVSVANGALADPVVWLALDTNSRSFDSVHNSSGVSTWDSNSDPGNEFTADAAFDVD